MFDSGRLRVLCGLLLLTGCGFSPVYGSHDAGSQPVVQALGSVQIENIPDRRGQILRNKLIDRMYTHGRPQDPQARLNVSITATEAAMAVQKDSTSTRSQLNMSANFTLVDMDGNALHKGSAHSVASYSKLSAQYGTLATQQTAYDRALNEIGEQIVNNLSLYYAEKPPAQEPAKTATK